MKKLFVTVSLVLFCSANMTNCGIGSGFGKIWDGTKDVVTGSWEVVTSPFRGGTSEGDQKESKDKKQKKETQTKSKVKSSK